MAEAAMTDAQRPWIRHYPEGISWDTPLNTTPVHEQVLATCARVPDSIALDFLGRKTSFGELAKAINAFAGALQSRFGIRKGSRVALLLPNCPFYVVAYYAILRTGATVVNCNPLYTVPELTHIVASSGADLMVTLDLMQLFEKAEALTEAGHVKSLIVCHFSAALPGTKSLLFRLVKGKEIAKVADSRIAAKITRYEDMLARNLQPGPVSIEAARDVAVQQYTGGTTGLPKGAMLSHANIAANAAQAKLWFARVCQPGKAGIAVLPFFHIFAMTSCLNLPLTSGMTMYLLPRFELKAFLDLLGRSSASLLPAVPTLITALAHKPTVTPRHLQALELVVSGGAALPGELRDAFAAKSNARLVEGYGLT
ncbi:MAG TPA: long-chain fatty acid--CoA ligase, partial [Alphaproteobacteria bacterium]|nr:long-chain fatty acid--CoA ligase [Alphaproteobacteria bacterium]